MDGEARELILSLRCEDASKKGPHKPSLDASFDASFDASLDTFLDASTSLDDAKNRRKRESNPTS